jgi:hypothetical protein
MFRLKMGIRRLQNLVQIPHAGQYYEGNLMSN